MKNLVLFLKADRMVRAHIRDGKFVKQYQQKYKLGTQHEVHVPDGVFQMLGIEKRPVFGDWARMFDKHKMQFKSPEHVAKAAQWVLRRPDYVFRKEDNPMLMNFIRQNYKQPFEHPILAINFMYKHGSKGYIVRSMHMITNDQVSGKVADAVGRQLGGMDVNTFEFGSSLVKAIPSADEYVMIRAMVPEKQQVAQ